MLPSEASHFAAVRSCVPPWLRIVESLFRTKLGNVLACLVRSSSSHPAISGDPSICIGPRRGARPARPGPPQLQGTKSLQVPQCVERRCISHTLTPARVKSSELRTATRPKVGIFCPESRLHELDDDDDDQLVHPPNPDHFCRTTLCPCVSDPNSSAGWSWQQLSIDVPSPSPCLGNEPARLPMLPRSPTPHRPAQRCSVDHRRLARQCI
jgi:hypothetical protein